MSFGPQRARTSSFPSEKFALLLAASPVCARLRARNTLCPVENGLRLLRPRERLPRRRQFEIPCGTLGLSPATVSLVSIASRCKIDSAPHPGACPASCRELTTGEFHGSLAARAAEFYDRRGWCRISAMDTAALVMSGIEDHFWRRGIFILCQPQAPCRFDRGVSAIAAAAGGRGPDRGGTPFVRRGVPDTGCRHFRPSRIGRRDQHRTGTPVRGEAGA